ncbi:MAG: F0F1 ATP synthase subunit B [Pseudomonadota bacterium]|nr:F0F1 ATP synthase subunit B [Pseudomonadota bacterium]
MQFDDPRLWVAVAFALFVTLFYKKLAGFVARTLDERSAKIKADLDEAHRLREEAHTILTQYKRKQMEYAREAEAMLAQARRDADTLRIYAEKELKATLDARLKQAGDRIAREEEKAIAEVRNHVVDIALAAARALIADHIGHLSQEELVRLALTDIERKVH